MSSTSLETREELYEFIRSEMERVAEIVGVEPLRLKRSDFRALAEKGHAWERLRMSWSDVKRELFGNGAAAPFQPGERIDCGPITIHAPDKDRVKQLLKAKSEIYKSKIKHRAARSLVQLRVEETMPIGILVMGDPHVDDDGCDIDLIQDHIDLVKNTDGLYAVCLGDVSNNWVGRLKALHGQQKTREDESWDLVQWYVESLAGHWLFLIGGNHDGWSGSADPIKWFARAAKAFYEPSGTRFNMRFPNGREVRINARHNFPGNSMYHPNHGQAKWAMTQHRDHLLIGGHKHSSGQSVVRHPETGELSHCVQVGSYKRCDSYAKELGLRDNHISSAVLVVIDPMAETETGLISVDMDIDRGITLLNAMRQKHRLNEAARALGA